MLHIELRAPESESIVIKVIKVFVLQFGRPCGQRAPGFGEFLVKAGSLARYVSPRIHTTQPYLAAKPVLVIFHLHYVLS
jgi:hypothetical protein